MSKKVMSDWGEVNEPNQDDSLSKLEISRLKRALSKLISENPKYKEWIYAVEFNRETFHKDKYIFMFVYLKDVDVDHIDAMRIESNILEQNSTFSKLLYGCEVLGSYGYIEENTDNWIFIESFIRNEIRGDKLNSLLDE